jgi:hypothetical protein
MVSNPAKKTIDGDIARVEMVVSSNAERALERLGRTEDIRFSPDNSRLAITDFLKNICFIFDVEIDRSDLLPVVRVKDFMELHSQSLKNPHGLEFIDNKNLIVANREGVVTIFALPESGETGRVLNIDPVRSIGKAGLRKKINSPGSVCLVSSTEGRVEILVCNNYLHRVSRHVFSPGRKFGFPQNSLLLENGLAVPDGIAINPDKTWIAVSNHKNQKIVLYDRRTKLGRKSEPSGALFGVTYPHGLRFSPDGRRLYVSDAGARDIHLFESADGNWRGERHSVASMNVLDEATFLRGNFNPQEGGTKSIDIDAQAQVMAVTCEEQVLAFFHLPALG